MKLLFLGILLKITSSLCKMKSEVTIGVKNTANHTHSLYILLTVMEIFDTILCFIFDDNDHDTNFVYEIQTKGLLLITLKKTFQLCIRSSISLMAVLNNVIAKTLLICVIISKISVWMLNG